MGLAVAGIVLSLGALYSMTFIFLGIAGMYGTAGTSIEDLEWRGWLGIGLATCVPVFMVWRALGKLKAEVELNHRLMKSSRGHDLIAKWYVVLERRPVVQSQTAGGRGHRDHGRRTRVRPYGKIDHPPIVLVLFLRPGLGVLCNRGRHTPGDFL